VAEWWHRVLESGGDLDFAEEPLVAALRSLASLAVLPLSRSAATPSRAADQQPLKPGEPAELVLDLMPTSVLFHRGSRIRVVVTGADAYTFRTAPVSPAPTLRVLRDPEHRSRIVLPVILARAE